MNKKMERYALVFVTLATTGRIDAGCCNKHNKSAGIVICEYAFAKSPNAVVSMRLDRRTSPQFCTVQLCILQMQFPRGVHRATIAAVPVPQKRAHRNPGS